MPRFNDDDLETHKLATGNYGFSAAKIDSLGATEYTLVSIVTDASSSVQAFEKDMETCLKEIVKACKYSPRADNLLLRLSQFSSSVKELHGFKTLESCNLDDYSDILEVYGMTALRDGTHNGAAALAAYGKKLMENDYSVNAILFVITDGEENHSTLGVAETKKALADGLKQECLESLVTILIGVNIQDPTLSQKLKDYKDEIGFNQYIELGNAKASSLAKLAEFVSKSISSQSQALGTGGQSKAIQYGLTI